MTWMDRDRYRPSRWVITGFILFMSIVATVVHEAKALDHSPVHHIVICWLEEPGNESARQELIDAAHGLADIPGVLDVRAGTVLPSDRGIVDSSFDVAIIFSFSDHEAMVDYLSHPHHQQTLNETIRPLVRKILVYDFVTGI